MTTIIMFALGFICGASSLIVYAAAVHSGNMSRLEETNRND